MPKVSVIVPTYNCAQYLPEALDSALAQTYSDFEILIIDDGSTDDTKKILEPYLKTFKSKIRNIYQENKGHSLARNNGLKNAKGEFIAFLDADDKWYPHRLEEEIKLIEANPVVGLVHANAMRLSEDGRLLGAYSRKKQYLSGFIFKPLFLRLADISCATVLLRKSCCDNVGYFDTHLTRLGCEDRELWLRIAKKYRIEYVDQVLAYYRVRDASASRDSTKMLNARLYVIDKFCKNDQSLERLRKPALAKIYRDLGDDSLFKSKFHDAKDFYKKSLSFGPWAFWSWVNLVKSLLKVKVRYVP